MEGRQRREDSTKTGGHHADDTCARRTCDSRDRVALFLVVTEIALFCLQAPRKYSVPYLMIEKDTGQQRGSMSYVGNSKGHICRNLELIEDHIVSVKRFN